VSSVPAGLGSATGTYLIVNADDFGLSVGVNRGIAEAFERGIVTSASLLVRWPAAGEASAYGRRHPALSLGLHVDLGEWVYRDGVWAPRYEVVTNADAGAVEAEVLRQLAVFRQLLGRDPSHLDSHQHVHRAEPARSVLLALAGELSVPVRHFTGGMRYCGAFHGQTGRGDPLPEAVGVDRLIQTLAALAPGVTELACHPGYGHDLESPYRDERALEVAVLCDPRVQAALALHRVQLVSFGDVPGRYVGPGRR
jgi:chitin disaccharide deacetylase